VILKKVASDISIHDKRFLEISITNKRYYVVHYTASALGYTLTYECTDTACSVAEEDKELSRA
jgi:hypothetical protein